MNKFNIIIPARMASTRLANKMLLDVAGLPLIVRVAKQALKSKATRVIVATDHLDIYNICQNYAIEVVMTNANHQSGTDRLAEAAKLLNLAENEVIINVQGDEPLIDPGLINQLAEFIIQKNTEIATIAHPITDLAEIFNPNVVKTIINAQSLALYFSRSPIPFYRDGYAQEIKKINPLQPTLRHIGIYAYKVRFLNIYNKLPISNIEQIESLEQLRALYHGYKIAVMITDNAPAAGIDTLEDLYKVRSLLTSL